jgi:hypothetical protein
MEKSSYFEGKEKSLQVIFITFDCSALSVKYGDKNQV